MNPALMTGANYPRENGYLKVRLRKAFKMAGFINPLPRKGTETVLAHLPLGKLYWFINPLPRKGTETPHCLLSVSQ